MKAGHPRSWSLLALIVVAGCTGGESHFTESTKIELVVVVSPDGECPETTPYLYSVGGDCPAICTSEAELSSELAQSAMVAQGGDCAVGKPSLICMNDCVVDTATQVCELQEDGCKDLVSKPPPVGSDCCAADADCAAGTVCVGAASAKGSCETAPSVGTCWSGADCAAGETCEGASTCPCDADCANVAPGVCTPLAAACCTTDADCSDGTVCVDGGGGKGACETAPSVGACWAVADCAAGETCEGASVCPCDVDCDNVAPGACVPVAPPEGCCSSDTDCVDGAVCVDGAGGKGSCEKAPAPDTGQCWSGADCAADETCDGAATCPCDLDCDNVEPGTCVGPEPVGEGCCVTGADCDDGSVCVDTGGGKGACELAAPAGKCWSAADCGAGQVCLSPLTCPCDMDCGNVEPGICAPTAEECCVTSADCTGDEICVDTGDDKGRCVPPAKPGDCWTAADCGAGLVCSGTALCPCGVPCAAIAPGKCSAPAGCCTTDSDCAGDAVCAGAADGGPGTCELAPAGGACWDDGDCGAGQACFGAALCPCGVLCGGVSPGLCGPVGACCVADADCGDGLVCAAPEGAAAGQCGSAADVGECWSSAECAPDEGCVGIQACQCGASCKNIGPGKCTADPPAGACSVFLSCEEAAPTCAPPLVPTNKNGCWSCGFPDTCTCSDSFAVCLSLPPDCPDGQEVAVKSGCWACVDPITCE